jgi:hypothetical protein
MIVGLTGYAQHGKDSLGTLFEGIGYRKYAFADGLRKCVLTLDPLVYDDVDVVRYSSLLADEGYEGAKRRPEVRRLLQVFGTEVGRNILGEDTWVNALHVAWANDLRPNAVITDVRFHNEADFIHEFGGILIEAIRLNEDGTPFDNGIGTDHPSERFIKELPVDAGIVARNLDELKLGFDMVCESRGLR